MFKLSDFKAIEIIKYLQQTVREESASSYQTAASFRLLVITQFYPPDYAATGQLIQELSTQLSKENIQVNVFTGQPGYAFKEGTAPTKEQQGLLKIKRSRSAQFWSQRVRGKTLNGIVFCLRALLHLLRSARKNDIVLLTTAPPFLSTVGYLANLLFKLDYVCLVYDLYPDVATELGVILPQHPIAKLWHKLNSLVWQRSKKIVVLSETMKERIVARHPQVAQKISVIHNWANSDWIKPLAKKQNWFARQHGIDRQFTVLYSGNLGRCHDLETILGAMKLLKDKPIQFVFIGAGAKHEACRQTAKEENLTNCIFLPYQDRENLPFSLTACDLALVSIARGFEGVVAPSKLYGIMAAGRAIAAICEPHSYLRKLIDDANCGACFDNNNSRSLAEFILTLLQEPNKAIELGEAGRNYMEQYFTPKIIARQYSEVLSPNEKAALAVE